MEEITKKKKKKPVITRKITENGVELTCHFLPYQEKAKDSKQRISGIVGGRGCGKTVFVSAMAFLEIIQGGKVLLFAQDYKALINTVFGEIVKRFREAQLEPKVNYQQKTIFWGEGSLYGFSYENIDSVRGMSEISLLILDEMALAPANIFEVATPCLRGSKRNTRILFSTTPNKETVWNKWFLDTSDKDIFRATTMDNTELTEEEIELQKKAIKNENAYKQEILGEILDNEISFSVVSRKDFPTYYKGRYGLVSMGIDCSGSGCDFNVFTVVDENGILEIVKEQVADTFRLTNIANGLIEKWNVKFVNIDNSGGFGQGLYDMLKNNDKVVVNQVNFGQSPKNKDIYVNWRAEAYFNLAEKIKNGFYIDNEEIIEELSYTTYSINNKGKTQLRPKGEIKEYIGRSPDASDSLILACYTFDNVPLSKAETLKIVMNFASL